MRAMTSPRLVSGADLERETGLGKDLLRKWRSRYGFPAPVRQPNGSQGYPREQMRQLRLIKRLQDSGFRPAQIVGKPLVELERLLAAIATATPVQASPCTRAAIDLLKAHDMDGLEALLRQQRTLQTLADFVAQTIAPLTVGLGEAWARGEIEIYHEHLCTAVLLRLLYAEISTTRARPGFPRIVYATPPDELHALGLLMAQAILSDLGAHAIGIGTQIPLADLVLAAKNTQADIVALSFSFAYPPRRIRPLLTQLRAQLPASIKLWVGGAGVLPLKRPPRGVRMFSDLRQAGLALLAQVPDEHR